MSYFKVLLEKEILKEELENHLSTIINTFISYKLYIDTNLKGKIKTDFFEYVDLIYKHIKEQKMEDTVNNFLSNKDDGSISKHKFFEILNLKLINKNFSTQHINFCNKIAKKTEIYDKELAKLMYYYNIIANKNKSAVTDYYNKDGKEKVDIFQTTYDAEQMVDIKTGKRYRKLKSR